MRFKTTFAAKHFSTFPGEVASAPLPMPAGMCPWLVMQRWIDHARSATASSTESALQKRRNNVLWPPLCYNNNETFLGAITSCSPIQGQPRSRSIEKKKKWSIRRSDQAFNLFLSWNSEECLMTGLLLVVCSMPGDCRSVNKVCTISAQVWRLAMRHWIL